MNVRGQTAVEYLITTSFLLVITGIIFAYALFIYTDSTASSTGRSAVSTIVNAVDQTYALGPNNIIYTETEIPPNVFDVFSQTNADNNVTAFVIRLKTSAGISDVAKSARTLFVLDAAAQGALKVQGRYRVKVSWPEGQDIRVSLG